MFPRRSHPALRLPVGTLRAGRFEAHGGVPRDGPMHCPSCRAALNSVRRARPDLRAKAPQARLEWSTWSSEPERKGRPATMRRHLTGEGQVNGTGYEFQPPWLGVSGRYFISLRSNHHEQHLWDAEQQTRNDTPCHGPRREFWRPGNPITARRWSRARTCARTRRRNMMMTSTTSGSSTGGATTWRRSGMYIRAARRRSTCAGAATRRALRALRHDRQAPQGPQKFEISEYKDREPRRRGRPPRRNERSAFHEDLKDMLRRHFPDKYDGHKCTYQHAACLGATFAMS